MAFQTPAAVMLNENIQIHKGKRADAPSAKPLKPSVKPALQERKALQDVSNIPKGTALNNRSAVKERSILKDKSILKDRSILKDKSTIKDRSILKEKSILKRKPAHGNHEAIKNPVNVFADEETKKCHEWAKDGVEGTHFTGNDSQKLDKDMQDKCVQKKVAKVMSAFNGWSDVVFDPVMFPAKDKMYNQWKSMAYCWLVLTKSNGSSKLAIKLKIVFMARIIRLGYNFHRFEAALKD